jgi:hypothetical protein
MLEVLLYKQSRFFGNGNPRILSGLAVAPEFRRQPAACCQCPQPEPQEVEAQEEQDDDDVLPIFPPKADINFSVFFDRQTGQDASCFSRKEKNSSSNILSHFLHLNS